MKKYIAERNAREAAAGSGSGDVDAPSTPATEIPVKRARALPVLMLLKMG